MPNLTRLIGPTGPAGPTGPPGVGAAWRGTWSSATTYALGDGVYRNGLPYISNSNGNLNHDPTPDTGTNWGSVSHDGLGSTFINVKDSPYGAKGDGVTDDTVAIQAGIDFVKTNGGILFFPIGVYRFTTTLFFSHHVSGTNQFVPYIVRGASPGDITAATQGAMLWYDPPVPASAPLALNFWSVFNFTFEDLAVKYTAGFTGKLIDISGGFGDCTNWVIRNISTRTDGASTAQSCINMDHAINGLIENCQLGRAVNALRFEPVAYCVGIRVTNCTFNYATDAHILLGSPDGENISIDNNRFEAGTNTTAIRGALVASGDAASNLHYSLTIANNWFGDSTGAIDWMKDVQMQGGAVGFVTGNFFAGNAVGGHHLMNFGGVWIVMGNNFNNGIVYSGSGLHPISIMNNYGNCDEIFHAADYATNGGVPDSYWSFGSWGSPTKEDSFSSSDRPLNFSNVNGAFVGGGQGMLAIAAKANGGYETSLAANKAALYAAGATPALMLHGTTAGIRLGAGATPTDVVTVHPNQIGFFGATPVAQAARAGQLTDSTGGTVSATLAAGITDSVAKNAIASLAAKVNALETIIHNLGLSA